MRLVSAALTLVLLFSTAHRPARADDDDATVRAKEHFRRGTAFYDTSHYMEAAAEYEAAL